MDKSSRTQIQAGKRSHCCILTITLGSIGSSVRIYIIIRTKKFVYLNCTILQEVDNIAEDGNLVNSMAKDIAHIARSAYEQAQFALMNYDPTLPPPYNPFTIHNATHKWPNIDWNMFLQEGWYSIL